MFVDLEGGKTMCYNSFSNSFLILEKSKHDMLLEKQPYEIEIIDPILYKLLVDNEFIVDDDVDELAIVEFRRISKKLDSTLYNVVVNTTLDCNLNCWYCYENKHENSVLNGDVIELVKKNIKGKYLEAPYKVLMVSFFGGEPLLNIDAIKNILLFCRELCDSKGVELIADFTTNLTLLTDDLVCFLSDYKCRFQVTFDGDEKRHNKVRFYRSDEKGTYETILNNLYKIQEKILDSKVWVRVNFDNHTLMNFDNILRDISHLDRKRFYLIIRKVWQLNADKITKEYVLNALDSALKQGFYIDNYSLPRTYLCFAERFNEVLINYDGKVFKCSTYESFDDSNIEGTIDRETGAIHWNIPKLAKKIMRKTPERCVQCKLFPACLGPCSRKCKSEIDSFNCMIDSTVLSMEEFIMYNFRLALVRKQLGL